MLLSLCPGTVVLNKGIASLRRAQYHSVVLFQGRDNKSLEKVKRVFRGSKPFCSDVSPHEKQ